MRVPFSWVSNHQKLERAKGELGPEATEEAIKERYIELGGLVLPDYDHPEVAEAPEKPKRRSKKEEKEEE